MQEVADGIVRPGREVVVAQVLGEAHHHRADLGRGEAAVQGQQGELLGLDDRPQAEALRRDDFHDGTHHDHPPESAASGPAAPPDSALRHPAADP
ncbi:hypothetical protein ACFQ1I_45590 [Kitasatospora arboriphila]